MRVLLLGGTGAIGSYLVDILANNNYKVSVTSRSVRHSSGNVTYIQGNAFDSDFLASLCEERWDAIVDFMSYKTDVFRKRVDILLNSTEQYFYISSARVYSDAEHPIKESSPRLLDIIDDQDYLSTDEYALTKARQENILKDSGKNNFTIIRPYITYGNYRLQLGVLEKEEWLYRALKGRTVVFSGDIADRVTTLTNGYDVAYGIFKLIGNPQAYGEVFHITSKQHLKWNDVLSIYSDQLKSITGNEIAVKFVDVDTFIKTRNKELKYQVIYDRLYNRDFDTTKESLMANADSFVSPYDGLKSCMSAFLSKIEFKTINWSNEGYKDCLTNEWTSYSEINNFKQYIKYLLYRLGIKHK